MNIVITGASQGLGKAIAIGFSKLERTHLYLISRSERKLNQVVEECESSNTNISITKIIYDLDRILLEELPAELDCTRIDILINNAGLLVKKEFSETNSEDMMDMATINFLVPACLIRMLLHRMGGDKPSHVVNISSMAGFQGSVKFPGLSIYSATKAALASLTECLAAEITGKNIYFNCLALGAVKTEMLATAFPGYEAPLNAKQMAEFIIGFSINGYKYFNGKVLPVSLSTP